MYRVDTLLTLHFAKATQVITFQASGMQFLSSADNLKEFFGKVNFESMKNYPACKELK